MSATHRAEVDARWHEFVTQIRGCRVQGECEHCNQAVIAFRRWAEGREDAAPFIQEEHGRYGVVS